MVCSLTFALFPFNCTGGLGGQVEENAVDALDLGGDAGHDLVQNGVRDLLDGGGHGILGVDGTDDGRPARCTSAIVPLPYAN